MRLIDADTLKEAIKNDMYVVDYGVECAIYGMFWSGIEYEIDEQPTVEQKTGKWIVWGGMDVSENHGRHKCSECGEFALLRYEKPLRKEILSDFCPNCGAKMEVEDD